MLPRPNNEYAGPVTLSVTDWKEVDSKASGHTYVKLLLSDGGFFTIGSESTARRIELQIARTLFAPKLTFRSHELLATFVVSTQVPLILHREVMKSKNEGAFGDSELVFWNYLLIEASE